MKAASAPRSRDARRRAPLLARLALLAGSTVLCLALAEGAARLHAMAHFSGSLADAFAEPINPARGKRVSLGEILRPSTDPTIVYELKPELDVIYHGARLRTNASGWREQEFAVPKPRGTIRILGLGDSWMFGWAVEEEERYLDRLESALREAYPERRWETLAFAAPGYNLPMEIRVLRRYGLRSEPDLIVYGYVGNDACLPNFVAPRPSPWAARSFLWDYLRGASRIRPGLVFRDEVLDGATDGADFETRYCTPATVPEAYRGLVGLEHFSAALDELATIGAERGIPVVFLSHTWRRPYDETPLPADLLYADATREINAFVRERGLDDPRQSALVVSPRDPHPSSLGHAMIADSLFRQLRERGVWRALLNGQPLPEG